MALPEGIDGGGPQSMTAEIIFEKRKFYRFFSGKLLEYFRVNISSTTLTDALRRLDIPISLSVAFGGGLTNGLEARRADVLGYGADTSSVVGRFAVLNGRRDTTTVHCRQRETKTALITNKTITTTVFAEINVHPEISAHQKEGFFKEGSTQNR